MVPMPSARAPPWMIHLRRLRRQDILLTLVAGRLGSTRRGIHRRLAMGLGLRLLRTPTGIPNRFGAKWHRSTRVFAQCRN